MADQGPPIYEFSSYKPITMSVIGSYDVGELNLPAIFLFLPVTDQILSRQMPLQKKQGKICFSPELNRPGEILSMRYDKQVRGIIRSDEPKSFPHSIIIDIGTSDRIISMKLSRSLKLNGPRSMEVATEAVNAVFTHIKNTQADLEFIRTHSERAYQLKEELVSCYKAGFLFDESETNKTDNRIVKIFKQQIRGYPVDRIEGFLDFMLSFNRNLYTGTLQLTKLESEMVNIQFNLGFAINKVAFYGCMNEEPFTANYNTVKPAAPVNVNYKYTKYDLTGQAIEAKHSIRVNRSGHVRHSGPNLAAMEPVYYGFIKRVLENISKIQSVESGKLKLKLIPSTKSYSVNEWLEVIRKQEDLREKILTGVFPIAMGEQLTVKVQEPIIKAADIQHAILNDGVISSNLGSQVEEPAIPTITFNYSPVVQI